MAGLQDLAVPDESVDPGQVAGGEARVGVEHQEILESAPAETRPSFAGAAHHQGTPCRGGAKHVHWRQTPAASISAISRKTDAP